MIKLNDPYVKRLALHVLFWLLAGFFIWAFVKLRSPDALLTLPFVLLLMPITILTSWVFNYHLITKKLHAGKYLEFALYSVLTFTASVYFQSLLVMGSFIWLANYSYGNLGPVASNVLYLSVCTYFIIFLNTIIFLFKRDFSRFREETEEKKVPSSIKILSERRNLLVEFSSIFYIESFGNYIKIHTPETVHLSKGKMAAVQETVPDHFIRIHRSFIINTAFVQSYNREMVIMKNGDELNISRTYKGEAIGYLEKQGVLLTS